MATFVRPSLEECEEPVVGSSGKCADTNGGVEVCVGKNTINIKGDDLMNQMEFEGGSEADATC